MHAHAVIGAQYGDEGKGLMVDALAHRGLRNGHKVPLVIRTNGGAQAGHTVVLPNGTRHVFSHFGSGSLAGAETHLSQFMIINPIMFRKEREMLMSKRATVYLSVDQRAPITTPYDMLINQIAETHRSGNRHGSCGLGIGETIERTLHEEFQLQHGFKAIEANRHVLKMIRNEWVPRRLSKLGVEPPPEFAAIIASDDLVENFLSDLAYFSTHTGKLADHDIRHSGSRQIIFEGAQGLMLDQDYGTMPHVTRSNTGLKNMIAIAEEAGIGSIDVNYMTRCYTTRHGAGPLEGEVEALDGIVVEDATNVPNDWQGSLRLAPIDPDKVMSAIYRDLDYRTPGIDITHRIVATCCDQVKDAYVPVRGSCADNDALWSPHAIPRLISSNPRNMTSWGPTRETLKGW